MRVLVTGAAGTVGGAVTRALLRRRHQVLGTVTRVADPVPDGVRPLVVNLFDPVALQPVAGEFDAAVHAAATHDQWAGELDRTVVCALLEAFDGTGKALVYTSTAWLHGDTGDVPATEDSPQRPPTPMLWRPTLEQLLVDGTARGVRTVRIRPGLVYGGGRGYASLLLTPRLGVARCLSHGMNRWAVVHADDLGDLYALAVERAPAGSVYLGVSDQRPRGREIAQAVADRAGAVVRSWDPADACRALGGVVDALLLDQVASAGRARRELGWRPSRKTLAEEFGLSSKV
jgi:nucleoside-diphosphate-sugar epimerase